MGIIRYWLLVSICRVNSFSKAMSIFFATATKRKEWKHVYYFPEAALCSHFQQLTVIGICKAVCSKENVIATNKWIHDHSALWRSILVERGFCCMVLGKKKPGLSSSRL